MGIHTKRKFVEQLKGTYIDYETFFDMLTARLEFPPGGISLNARILLDEFVKYRPYLYTDTDVDWKTVCFEILYAAGERDISWLEGLWCSPGRFSSSEPDNVATITKTEYHGIIQEFVKWMDNKISNEKLFLPNWYKVKFLFWEKSGIFKEGDLK